MSDLNFITPILITKKPRTVIKKTTLQMNTENFEEKEKSFIPGKIIIPDNIIKEREIKLKALSEAWKKERLAKEEKNRKTIGFTKNSEILNGRMAMFFFVTGLLTELWTGQTIPGQIETILRTLGIL